MRVRALPVPLLSAVPVPAAQGGLEPAHEPDRRRPGAGCPSPLGSGPSRFAMPLDPALAEMLRALEALGSRSRAGDTPEVARKRFRRLTVGLRRPEHVVPVADTEEIEVDGGAGPLAARLYRPAAEGPLPTLVFFHGGGF